jgi:membrane protein
MRFVDMIEKAYKGFKRDKGFTYSAAIAYYGLISFIPLAILIFVFLGIFMGQALIQQRLFEIAFHIGGERALEIVQPLFQEAVFAQRGIASLLSILIALFSVSFLFSQMQEAFDTMWGTKPSIKGKRKWLISFIKEKIFSAVIVLVIAILILASFVTAIIRSYLGDFLVFLLPPPIALLAIDMINYAILFAFLSFFLVFLFRNLVRKTLKPKDLWPGAVFTALLLSVGQIIISIYFNIFYTETFIGVTGSLIAFLLWAFYSGAIFFFGAEFTKIYARKHGSLKRK